MKKLGLAILAFVLVTANAQAQSNSEIEKIAKLSAELNTLEISLDQAIESRTSSAVKFVISSALSIYLVRHVNRIHATNPDIDSMLYRSMWNQTWLGIGVGSYAVVNGATVGIEIVNIPKFREAITAKKAELESAKRVLEAISPK